ncbi:unnamed protein product [Chironomus riparius]|uniref:Uncharacterized protein n=1 Tax=Chironomus riparius TaxID=315576 RepID=A0A9N9WTH8_9DIPT|nr:unnamed protein product [Chironomus riparius]
MIILDTNFKVFRGTPPCGKMTHISSDEDGDFSKVPYRFDYSGGVVVNNKVYSISRYCFAESNNDWKLMTCHQDYYLQKVVHISTILLSISILSCTLFVYIYFREPSDFYGKCIISLVLSQILTYTLLPIVRFASNDSLSIISHELLDVVFSLFAMSLMLVLLWITAMIVHLFFTLSFKTQLHTWTAFSTYSIFVWTFAAFSAIVFYFDLHSDGSEREYLIFLYTIIGFVDIFLLVVTGLKILLTAQDLANYKKFENGTKTLWIIIKLSIIMLTTWPFESFLWREDFDVPTETVVDFINLLTALTISLMLMRSDKILLFGKYQQVDDLKNDVLD